MSSYYIIKYVISTEDCKDSKEYRQTQYINNIIRDIKEKSLYYRFNHIHIDYFIRSDELGDISVDEEESELFFDKLSKEFNATYGINDYEDEVNVTLHRYVV